MQIRHPDGTLVSLHVATGWWERGIGLIGRRSLPAGQGWFFPRCRCVHTLGMRFRLDLIFVDADGVVVRAVSGVGPGRVVGCRQAAGVLELAAGQWRPLPAPGTRLCAQEAG